MVEVFTSRSGSPSIRIDGVALHSPYDPAREAERFAEAALGPETPSTVVVLGEGLGYLTRWVRGVHPSARVLKVHYSEEISRSSSSVSEADGDTWHPGLRVSVGEFLASRIGELDVEGLRMIEWPPSARLFPGLSRTANEALQQCLRELNGSLVTTISVGRLWLRNCVANFLSLGEVFRGAPCSPQRSIVITASGPSLESAAPLLREVRADVDIWALPSSAPFLREAGLKPDLLVMTDPGFFAIHHLHHAMPDCPVAMPLSAARGLWRLAAQGSDRTRSFLLEQPGLMEEVFLQALGIPAPCHCAPWNGGGNRHRPGARIHDRPDHSGRSGHEHQGYPFPCPPQRVRTVFPGESLEDGSFVHVLVSQLSRAERDTRPGKRRGACVPFPQDICRLARRPGGRKGLSPSPVSGCVGRNETT